MNAPARIDYPDTAPPPPRPEVRQEIKKLFDQTKAFQQLTPEQQIQTARDTALITDALVGKAEPGMQSVAARTMADDQWAADKKAVDDIGQKEFSAGSLMQGAAAAGEFLKQVNFVDFVSGLVEGVFHSIVTSNIQQMEAFSKMVSDVSKSLNQFRDDNTSSNDGKDHLVEQFPDVFDIGLDDTPGGMGGGRGGKVPMLKLRDGVDQDAALGQVKDALGSYADKEIESIDVTDPEVQETLIKAARGQIATSRQQLLATMVMMGLSRIVVTNGKISAKIMYDFNASSQRTLSRSAQAMDFARDAQGNLATLTDGEGDYEGGGHRKGDYTNTYESGKSTYSGNYDADYYTKGKYKYSQKPVMTAMAIAQDQSTDVLSAKASLAGSVDVNFKSDYMPLDKMATPEMIAAIQMRSKPVDHNKPQYTPGPAPAAAPAPAPAPAPARA